MRPSIPLHEQGAGQFRTLVHRAGPGVYGRGPRQVSPGIGPGRDVGTRCVERSGRRGVRPMDGTDASRLEGVAGVARRRPSTNAGNRRGAQGGRSAAAADQEGARPQRALQRLVGRVAQRGEVAHLAAGARLGLAVEVEPTPAPPALRAQAAASSPEVAHRFTIAAGRSSSVEPSGSPQTARTCCSNWLTTQASSVQCPELCGRGAISLTSTRRRAVTNISTASTPTYAERRPRCACATRRASSATAGGDAGRGRSRRRGCASRWTFSAAGEARRPAAGRARRSPRPRREAHPRLEDVRLAAPTRRRPAAASAGSRITTWPLPS